MNYLTISTQSKVQILRPAYVAGKIGVVLSPEVLQGGQPTRRWIVQVDPEMILSLLPEEFQLLERSNAAVLPSKQPASCVSQSVQQV